MFKVGDKVYYIKETHKYSCGLMEQHGEYVVTGVQIWYNNPNHPPKLTLRGFEDFTWNGANFTLDKPNNVKPAKKVGKQAAKDKVIERKPHKHAAIIKAWADGAEIEVFQEYSGKWMAKDDPAWNTHFQYRVKPEKKPDVVITRCVYKQHIVDIRQSTTEMPNVKYTFDGETDKLKAVELI